MNTTLSSGKSGINRAPRGGFTLVEVLIAASIGVMVMGAVMSSFIFLARSSVGISNYSDMNTESRISLETFGRDVRSAEGIEPGFSKNSFTLKMPDGGGNVSYIYRPNDPKQPLIRITPSGEEEVLMTGVEQLEFNYYNLQGESNMNMATMEVKQIQLQLKMVRHALVLQNTEKVVSARFILRNHKVA